MPDPPIQHRGIFIADTQPLSGSYFQYYADFAGRRDLRVPAPPPAFLNFVR